jgi:type VI secretion system protein ImpH
MSERRADQDEILSRLQENVHSIGFYAALRQIEAAFPDKPRLGTSKHANDDPVLLGQEPSMAFAASALASFDRSHEGPPRLQQFGLGVFGPNGALPLHLTEFALRRTRSHGDPTFARFVDLFHHRMLSLFYRAWANAQPTASFDRPDSDRFATYVAALAGLAEPSLQGRDAMPDLAKRHYTGNLMLQSKPADALRAMIEDYMRVPTEISEFVGQWLDLPERSHWRLGESPETGALGRTTTVGGRIWECQRKFRIELGPLTIDDYKRMLPEADSMERLAGIVRNYCGDEWMWDVRLVLKKEDVPPLVLGGKGRLGWTTWLMGRSFEHDPGDLSFEPMTREAAHV